MRLAALFILLIAVSLTHALTIRIGTPPYSPPFVLAIDNDNHYAGFDIDIIEDICQRIHAQCLFIPVEFTDEFAALEKGSIDIAIGNITITKEREQKFLFSLPYLASYAQYLTKHQYHINSLKDILGKTIGLQQGSVFENLVLQEYGKKVKTKSYYLLTDMLIGLNNDDVDVVILDQATAETWLANSDGDYQLIGSPIPDGHGYGIMTTLFNTALIDQINKALLSMEGDGSYLRIYQTYFSGSGTNAP